MGAFFMVMKLLYDTEVVDTRCYVYVKSPYNFIPQTVNLNVCKLKKIIWKVKKFQDKMENVTNQLNCIINLGNHLIKGSGENNAKLSNFGNEYSL